MANNADKNRFNNNKNGKRQNYNGKRNNFDNHKYVGAPYNFVPIPSKVVSVEESSVAVHDQMRKNLISGEISYLIKAETPVFTDDGKAQTPSEIHHFMKDEYGRYIIPGSSVRGLIRSNAQILSLSSFEEDIDDYQLMFRTVAGGLGSLGNYYNKDILGSTVVPMDSGKIGVLKNVKAGYLKNEKGEYKIYPSEVAMISKRLGQMNYYVLSERDAARNPRNYPYFMNHPERAQHVLENGFEKRKIKGRDHFIGTDNKSYHPGWYAVSYENSGHRVIALGEPGEYSRNGALISTGKMGEKKAHYVVPEINMNAEAITIPPKSVKAFQVDFEKKKNTLGDNKEFFNLPQQGEVKPVFYIGDDKRNLYFGFTPRLRLFYDYSVADGVKQERKDFDYTKAIFGKKGSLRSKVSFSDAKLISDPKFDEPISVILSEPKPTSYLDYVDQKTPKHDDNDANTYNTENFRIRGVKQYWLREKLADNVGKGSDKDKVSTKLKALSKGAEFEGKVRFQNLTEAELGLLLWSITLDQGCKMNIGKGKPFGLGVICFSGIKVKSFDLGKAYNTEFLFSPFAEGEINVRQTIAVFQREISQKIGRDIQQMDHILQFMLMKKEIPAPEKIRYMKIDKPYSEYQSRKKSLPSIENVLQE